MGWGLGRQTPWLHPPFSFLSRAWSCRVWDIPGAVGSQLCPLPAPCAPSPALAMGTEQSWALCRPSPAQLNRAVLSALPWAQTPAQQHPSCYCRKRTPAQPKPVLWKNFCRHFTFSNHPAPWEACGLLGQVTAISGEWIWETALESPSPL